MLPRGAYTGSRRRSPCRSLWRVRSRRWRLPTEQEVKAALIFNITRFVVWPAEAFGSASAPLVVAILGQDDVGDVLEKMLQRKSVDISAKLLSLAQIVGATP